MAYIVGADRYQTRMVTTSLDDLISKDNSVRVIDSYVESLNLENLGFIEYSGRNRGQSPYRRSDLLKLHIYGYLNKIRSSRALETEAKRNLELMWLINCITPDHGTIAGFVQKNKAAFHNTLRNLTLSFSSMNREIFLITLFADISLPTMIIQSSAYRTKLSPLFSISLSSSLSMMFASNGERFPPCGVPTMESSYSSSIIIPLTRYFLTIEMTSPSLIVLLHHDKWYSSS